MFYEINRAYLPLSNGTKGHGKTNKGNSRRAFCSQGLRHASRTRAKRHFKEKSATVRLCVCVCVCVLAKYLKLPNIKR